MPRITYHRFWCPQCAEWTLFHKSLGFTTDTCNSCGSVINESILLKDIPKEKVMEQRQRYKESRKSSGVFRLMTLGVSGLGADPFSEDWPQPEIIEHSAGQKEIDEKKWERMNKEIDEEKKIQAELKVKFGSLGRNDLCGCGSGKKFKKCCQPKIKKQYL